MWFYNELQVLRGLGIALLNCLSRGEPNEGGIGAREMHFKQ